MTNAKNPFLYKAADEFAEKLKKQAGYLFKALGADQDHYLDVKPKAYSEGTFLFESEYELISMPEYARKGSLRIASLPEAPVIIMYNARNRRWLDTIGKVLVGMFVPDLSAVDAERLYNRLLSRVEEESEILLDSYSCRIVRGEDLHNYIEFCSVNYDQAVQLRIEKSLGTFREGDFDFAQIMGRGITQNFLDTFPDIRTKGKPSGNTVYTIRDAIRIVADDGLVTGVRIEEAANFQVLTIHLGEAEDKALQKMNLYLVNVRKIPGTVGYHRYGYVGEAAFHDHVYIMTIYIFAGMVSTISLIKKV